MKKLYFTAIIAVIAIIQTFAQAPMNTDANIFGDVQSNGDHISFATILVQGTNITTATDATGHYKIINLDEGDYTIIAQTFGYKRSEQKVTVVEGKTVEVNFELEEDLIGLEEVVVSSDRDAVDRKSSNIIVNSLNKEVFNVTNSVSLAEGLDFTPGLRTENNCQNCGFTQVRMNGLDGPYSQILINSRPIFSGLAGVYGLELFPTNMIEKVEVVRGGGSAIFGGNAIAGTINIITKEPISNSFSLSSNISAAGLDQEELSFDRSLNFNASVVSDDLKSGLSLFGLIRDRDPYDVNGDGFSEEVLMENQTIGISTFYKPTTRTKLSLDLYRIHEFRRGGDQFEKLPHETLITEQLEHDIFGAGFAFDILTKSGNKYSVYTAGQTVDRASYYGAEGDRTAYGQTDDISMNSGLQYTSRFDFISNSKLIVGADHSYNQLEDIKLGADGADNTTISDQAVNTYGSFVQYELDFNIVKVSAGVRYDNYQVVDNAEDHDPISGNVIIPRANLLFNIVDGLQFRTSYARGYRAPQIFDEDLHIETSGLRRITHDNDPDLEQESSDSYSASFIYDNIFGTDKPVHFEFIAEGFYTMLNNPFVNEMGEPDEFGNVVFTRQNAESGALVYGVNLESSIAFSKNLMFRFGFTQQKSEYEEAQGWGEEYASVSKSFMRTPDSYGFLTAEFSPIDHLKLALTGTFTGSMLVPHFGGPTEEDIANMTPAEYAENEPIINAMYAEDIVQGEILEVTDAFLNMGAKISYDFQLKNFYKIRVNAGMENILDEMQHDHDRGVYRDAGYIYGPHRSRGVFFGLEIGTGI